MDHKWKPNGIFLEDSSCKMSVHIMVFIS